MKKTLLLMGVVCAAIISNAQTYQLNGKLGIGMEPIEKLDVDGNMRVTGFSFLQGETNMTGTLTLNSDLKVPGLVSPENTTTILSFDSEGKVDPLSIQDFMNLVYDLDCKEEPGQVFTPVWHPTQGKLTVDGGNCNVDPLVGIGTTNPQYLLDVFGDTRVSGSLIVGETNPLVLSPSSNGIEINGGMGLSGQLTLNANDNYSSVFAINRESDGISLFSLNNQGAVIFYADNSTNSAMKIIDRATNQKVYEVKSSGELICTGLKVREMGQFPDYVFDPEYKLMTLKDLSEYIKLNRKLPNMPSAQEVAEEGADLGELNRLLVEKVEELTLYVLQQQKEIEKLKSERP